MSDRPKIRQFVEDNGRRFVETLKEACSWPSISAEGLGLDQMSGWLESALRNLGAKVSRLEVAGAPPALLGEIPGTAGPEGRTLMIYDHYDVQPVDPIDLWDSPPFEPAERDGRVFARGVADNKGDLIARLAAIETYREVIGELPFNVKFLVEGEEESGSVHFEQICRTYAERLGAELRSRQLAYDQHSSNAVYAPSAAWHLLRAVGSIKGPDGRVAIPGFYDQVVAPTDRDAGLLDNLPFDEASELERLGITSFAEGLSGAALRQALIFSPTANIAGFSTGYTVPGASKTVLPAEAMAKIDFRLVPEQDATDLARRLRRHLDDNGFADVEMDILAEENPSRSPTDSLLGQAVESTASEWWSGEPGVWPLMPATGPMYPISKLLRIPICSPPGVTRPDSAIHAPNEQIRISDYYDIIGYTAAYLDAYAQL
jgi:acetylornithine deacetylase/succinyl-diaminopimelate desuccinylase-like protein